MDFFPTPGYAESIQEPKINKCIGAYDLVESKYQQWNVHTNVRLNTNTNRQVCACSLINKPPTYMPVCVMLCACVCASASVYVCAYVCVWERDSV